MHRDLKPENILLSSKTNNVDIKISDFGLAMMSRDDPRRLPRSHSICGSDFYLAPEVIKQEEYGREIDLWAVGVITYVTLSGTLPFFHQVLHKLYRQIVERDLSFPEEAWKNVSKGALDFILRLLQVKAAERLTADQALNHQWLRGQSSGGSFRDLATLGVPRPSGNASSGRQPAGASSSSDLQKVLSKSYTNAHPLEHAHKVNNGQQTPAATSTTLAVSNLPKAQVPAGVFTAYSTGAPLTPLGSTIARQVIDSRGGIVPAPASNFVGSLQAVSRTTSRTTKPMVFR
jgi:serine/threonine protein kinase